MKKTIKTTAKVLATIITLAGFVGLCGECEHQILWGIACLAALWLGGKAMDKLGMFD